MAIWETRHVAADGWHAISGESMTHRQIRISAAIAGAALLLAACGGGGDDGSSSTEQSAPSSDVE